MPQLQAGGFTDAGDSGIEDGLGGHLIAELHADVHLEIDERAIGQLHEYEDRLLEAFGREPIAASVLDLEAADGGIGQPGYDVEFVDDGVVDERLLHVGVRDRRVAMGAAEHEQLTGLLRVDELAQLPVFGIETTHEPDLDEVAAGGLLGFEDPPRGVRVRGQRLLAQDRETGLEAGQQHGFVEEPGGRDEDPVDHSGLESVFDAGAADGSGGVLQRRGEPGLIGVDDGGDRGPADRRGDAFDVVCAHHSGTDDADAEIFGRVCHGHCLSCGAAGLSVCGIERR